MEESFRVWNQKIDCLLFAVGQESLKLAGNEICISFVPGQKKVGKDMSDYLTAKVKPLLDNEPGKSQLCQVAQNGSEWFEGSGHIAQ